MIAAEPANVMAWSGFIVAAAANGSTSAWRTLVRRPELVRGVYLAATSRRSPVSPLAVAEWLDQAAGISGGRPTP
jgi:hypothetical protein